MKKAISLALALLVMTSLLVACGGGEKEEPAGIVETTVGAIDANHGNLELKMTPDKLKKEGIVPGNEVLVEIGDYKAVLLYNNELLEGDGIEQIWNNAEDKVAEILIYNGDFAATYNVKEGDAVKLSRINQPEA